MKFLVFFLFLHIVFAENSPSDRSGVTSLALVVDKTKVFLEVVKPEIVKFLEESDLKNETNLEYILVPFNDEGVDSGSAVTDVNEFQKKIKDQPLWTPTKSRKNGIPPERECLSGIKKALELSLPRSIVVVLAYTKPKKDSNSLSQIQSAISANHTRVIFILTGDSEHISQAYKDIAEASYGQIFKVKEKQVKNVLTNIRSLMKSGRVDLLAAYKHSAQTSDHFTFNVDETVSEMLIAASAESNINLMVKDSSGKDRKTSEREECKLSTFTTSTICYYKKPLSGQWDLKVSTNSPYSLRVSAASDISFKFGFEDLSSNGSQVEKIFNQPIKGIENTLFVESKNGPSNKIFTNQSLVGELISSDGTFITNFSMKFMENKAESQIFYGTFMPIENKNYHLQVKGKTNDHRQFQRITPVALGALESTDKNNPHALEMTFIPMNLTTEVPYTSAPLHSAPPSNPSSSPLKLPVNENSSSDGTSKPDLSSKNDSNISSSPNDTSNTSPSPNDTSDTGSSPNDTSNTSPFSNDTSDTGSSPNDTSDTGSSPNDTSDTGSSPNDTSNTSPFSNDTSDTGSSPNDTSDTGSSPNDTSNTSPSPNDTSDTGSSTNDTSSTNPSPNDTSNTDPSSYNTSNFSPLSPPIATSALKKTTTNIDSNSSHPTPTTNSSKSSSSSSNQSASFSMKMSTWLFFMFVIFFKLI